jgi:hypothetical protein
MTPAQTMLYFREVGIVRDVMKAKGLPFGDVQRHALHKKALGQVKSSKDFTNADLDKVLGALRAISRPDDLGAQLRQLDQQELRNHEARKASLDLLVELGIGKGEDEDKALFLRKSYLDGIVKKITRGAHIDFQSLPDRQANAILHTLRLRRLAQQKAAAKHATPARADEQLAAKAELRRVIDQDANCPW